MSCNRQFLPPPPTNNKERQVRQGEYKHVLHTKCYVEQGIKHFKRITLQRNFTDKVTMPRAPHVVPATHTMRNHLLFGG